MLVSGFSGKLGDDLDTDDDGVLDILPWSTIIDSISLVESLTSGDKYYSDIVLGPDGSYVPAHAIRCDWGWLMGEFEFGLDDSPGVSNVCPVPTAAPGPSGPLSVVVNTIRDFFG
eukprot:CAMPEP_0118692506 /NCGR_PEP_ID=MMETSP0800-20121206/11330_1 /TAXON_ID=210618 ORGANISM="Striatella unipunctata, Strain CCMP2910" /NCGR_SAMPLE_ID=MMETSP0800 /ASSEMBLY_ACC=CAM_ASM_000638 /LENGTH=114 /DNA_ID=CAMNT_0006590517 /DNA_START=1 /DNA_END=345 /DNA_ORIENTATION=+